MWFRRDLRSRDHPALAAAADADRVVALFVLDDALRRPSGAPRLAFLYQSLRDLDAQLRQHGGELVVRRGTPENVVPAVARDAGATSVHISADFGPYGAARDKRVDAALGEVPRIRTGSAYAVALAASSSPTANRSGSSRRSTGRGRPIAGRHRLSQTRSGSVGGGASAAPACPKIPSCRRAWSCLMPANKPNYRKLRGRQSNGHATDR
jgi:hypothetical protein